MDNIVGHPVDPFATVGFTVEDR